MFIQEWIQALVRATEAGGGPRWLRIIPLALAVLALALIYDLTAYRGFNSPEAMDSAQVARNLAEGNGYSTDFIRPFSLYLVRTHNQAGLPHEIMVTNTDLSLINGHHPDLANAPVYPTVLAGWMKLSGKTDWKAETKAPFWSEGGRYIRFKPEFLSAIFNQILLLAVGLMTFLLARLFFDAPAAWLAATLTLASDLLWKFSVSGQSTLLLLLIFMGLFWCLAKLELRARDGFPDTRRLFLLAVTAGMLTGLGMLTRYSFGWVIAPVLIYLVLFGGVRRGGLAVAAFLAFVVVVSPWVVRNLAVSGTPFGTAGFAVVEGTYGFSGSRLMQSLNPDMSSAYWVMPYLRKLLVNGRGVIQGDLLRLGGGWMGILFFAGLLLGLNSLTARRMRYFTMMCLGMFVVVQALGQTQLSAISPEINSENLLVLLTPLVVIFGVAFFLTLLHQMKAPTIEVRYAVVGLLALIVCQPLIATLLPPKVSPVAYPPYYPPEIQKIAGWMREDELMMSDIPWAVAWYGHRQCTWTTLNSKQDFFALTDNLPRPVRGLYLTLVTLDDKLYSECLGGGAESWGNFALKTLTTSQVPAHFPLRVAPYGLMGGIFLTDRQRWETE